MLLALYMFYMKRNTNEKNTNENEITHNTKHNHTNIQQIQNK